MKIDFNLLKIKGWIYIVFFTIPSLFFGENSIIRLFLLCIYFISYLFSLTNLVERKFIIENSIECLIVIVFYFLNIVFDFDYTSNRLAWLFGLISILSLVRIAYCFRFTNGGIFFLVALSFFVPPIGVYYLKDIYKKNKLK